MLPVEKKAFLQTASGIARDLGQSINNNLHSFLQFAYDHPVVLNRKGGVDLGAARKPEEVETYLTSLLKAYFVRRTRRILLGDVKTVADPAVDTVLESFAQVPKDKLPLFSQYHRISMAAENKIGDLLEEYLANQLEPKGWFWCCCNIIKGVDFFRPGKQVVLLQVKNRDNSENSSSEKIRELLRDRGCPVEIQKWHRCQSSDGKACWDDFPNVAGEVSLSEQDFLRFLRDYPRRKH